MPSGSNSRNSQRDYRTRYIYEGKTCCGESYIGLSLDPERRWQQHERDMRNYTNTLGEHAKTCCLCDSCQVQWNVIDKARGINSARRVEKEWIQQRGDLNIQHNPNRYGLTQTNFNVDEFILQNLRYQTLFGQNSFYEDLFNQD